jgi:acyl carrier protein
MTRDAIETKIRSILTDDFRVPADAISAAATFRGSMKLDSLDIVDFIMLLQKDLGLKSSLESYAHIQNFGELVAFVDRAVNPPAR